jgi:hypothetical protein
VLAPGATRKVPLDCQLFSSLSQSHERPNFQSAAVSSAFVHLLITDLRRLLYNNRLVVVFWFSFSSPLLFFACLLACFFRRLSTLLLRIKNSRDQSETICQRKKHKDDPSLTTRTRRGMKTGGGETDDFFTGAPKSSSRKLSKSQKTLTYLLTYLQ